MNIQQSLRALLLFCCFFFTTTLLRSPNTPRLGNSLRRSGSPGRQISQKAPTPPTYPRPPHLPERRWRTGQPLFIHPPVPPTKQLTYRAVSKQHSLPPVLPIKKVYTDRTKTTDASSQTASASSSSSDGQQPPRSGAVGIFEPLTTPSSSHRRSTKLVPVSPANATLATVKQAEKNVAQMKAAPRSSSISIEATVVRRESRRPPLDPHHDSMIDRSSLTRESDPLGEVVLSKLKAVRTNPEVLEKDGSRVINRLKKVRTQPPTK